MIEDELEFKNSTEMNQYHRDMMSEEAKAEEDSIVCIMLITFLVVGFLTLLALSLGIAILWAMFT